MERSNLGIISFRIYVVFWLASLLIVNISNYAEVVVRYFPANLALWHHSQEQGERRWALSHWQEALCWKDVSTVLTTEDLFREFSCVSILLIIGAFLVAQMVKNVPAIWETWVRSLGWEDPLEKGMGNQLQYSCLENPMDRGAWRAKVHGVTKSWTWLSKAQYMLRAQPVQQSSWRA